MEIRKKETFNHGVAGSSPAGLANEIKDLRGQISISGCAGATASASPMRLARPPAVTSWKNKRPPGGGHLRHDDDGRLSPYR